MIQIGAGSFRNVPVPRRVKPALPRSALPTRFG
jgi:hypothetical protein